MICTNLDRQTQVSTDAWTHTHTRNYHDNYVLLTASGLDKKLCTLEMLRKLSKKVVVQNTVKFLLLNFISFFFHPSPVFQEFISNFFAFPHITFCQDISLDLSILLADDKCSPNINEIFVSPKRLKTLLNIKKYCGYWHFFSFSQGF